ncbi:glycosyltransferase family 4 protein [Aquipuribacter sp. SD81]|uniref:glycosyltransferase family 4 protein n=1 Tax=Aquipuribacter sp. SD81 TaxID=3127703 RepID=UPI00301908D5
MGRDLAATSDTAPTAPSADGSALAGRGTRVALVLSTPTKTVRSHVRGLVVRLVAAGVDVRLVGPRSVLATFSDVLDVRTRATVLPLGDDTRPLHDLAAAGVLRAAVRQHDVEVVHAHGFRAAAVSALVLRLLRHRPALVTTWHGLPFPLTGRPLTVRSGARLVARSSDVTLAASEDLRELAVRLGAEDVRTSPVAAPRVPAPREPRALLRARLAGDLGLRPEVPWVLAVGRIVPEKDHGTLLAAAARWRGLHPAPEVLLVGVGAAPVVARLRRQIAEERLPVRLLGARDDVADLMHAADVFVLTSRWEAPALAVQESMQAGLPVVATAVGGVPDVLGDAGVLVAAGDREAVAVEVARLLADPERAEGLAAAALARARSLPDEDEVAAAVLAAYADALRRRPRRAWHAR